MTQTVKKTVDHFIICDKFLWMSLQQIKTPTCSALKLSFFGPTPGSFCTLNWLNHTSSHEGMHLKQATTNQVVLLTTFSSH